MFTESLLVMSVYSELTIPAYGRHVTVTLTLTVARVVCYSFDLGQGTVNTVTNPRDPSGSESFLATCSAVSFSSNTAA
jgi:hypothetical protein